MLGMTEVEVTRPLVWFYTYLSWAVSICCSCVSDASVPASVLSVSPGGLFPKNLFLECLGCNLLQLYQARLIWWSSLGKSVLKSCD